MITVTRKYTRPSVDVAWHFSKTEYAAELTEFKEHLRENYIVTGKLLFQEPTEDLLTMTYTGIWDSRESFDLYDVDPILQKYWSIKDQYNASVGITMGPKEITNN